MILFIGGNVLLFEHLFWLFGHPEVYVIIIPVFGIISEAIEKAYNKRIFGKIGMIYAIASISILGLLVWAHHLYVTSLDVTTLAYFNAATSIIGIPTGIKIISWISSIYKRREML